MTKVEQMLKEAQVPRRPRRSSAAPGSVPGSADSSRGAIPGTPAKPAPTPPVRTPEQRQRAQQNYHQQMSAIAAGKQSTGIGPTLSVYGRRFLGNDTMNLPTHMSRNIDRYTRAADEYRKVNPNSNAVQRTFNQIGAGLPFVANAAGTALQTGVWFTGAGQLRLANQASKSGKLTPVFSRMRTALANRFPRAAKATTSLGAKAQGLAARYPRVAGGIARGSASIARAKSGLNAQFNKLPGLVSRLPGGATVNKTMTPIATWVTRAGLLSAPAAAAIQGWNRPDLYSPGPDGVEQQILPIGEDLIGNAIMSTLTNTAESVANPVSRNVAQPLLGKAPTTLPFGQVPEAPRPSQPTQPVPQPAPVDNRPLHWYKPPNQAW